MLKFEKALRNAHSAQENLSLVPDHGDVEVELKINGEVRQKENTSKMIFDVPTMIADIS